MTTLLTILLTRWSTPRTTRGHAGARSLALLPACVAALALHSLLLRPGGHGRWYYLSMIGWWASVPLVLLWYGTGPSWVTLVHHGQAGVWLACLALPTLYLCGADVYALRRGTWHIAEHRSLQVYAVTDLPIEEAIFFLATNLILISACLAFDRVVWQSRGEESASKTTEAPLSPSFFALDWPIVKRIWHTFVNLDGARSGKEVRAGEQQREHALAILARASKSFSTAASLLPWDLRVDMGCLYAFARAMDDFVDQHSSSHHASARIDLLRRLLSMVCDGDARPDAAVDTDLARALQEHREKDDAMTAQEEEDLRLSALAVRSLSSIIPQRLWHDLVDGYRIDSVVGGPHFTSFEQQADYAQSVAGSIGEMCVRVVLARLGITIAKEYIVPRDVTRDSLVGSQQQEAPSMDPENVHLSRHAVPLPPATVARILRDARRMGVCLQLVNIARDVAKDATDLGRCYLVTGRDDLSGTRAGLCSSQGAQNNGLAISRSSIFAEKCLLLDIADEIYRSTIRTIGLVPSTAAQTGLRVACTVYASIGSAIRRDGEAKCLERCTISRAARLWTVIKAVYWE